MERGPEINPQNVKFMLENFEHNLDETVGLFVNEDGQLCENIIMDHPIKGMYHEIVLEDGCYGLFYVDYAHA